MVTKTSNGFGRTIVIVLAMATLAVTIFLFFFLTNPASRSETFNFTVGFICLLELLGYGYIFCFLVEDVRERLSPTLWIFVGILIGIYVIVSILLVIGFNIPKPAEDHNDLPYVTLVLAYNVSQFMEGILDVPFLKTVLFTAKTAYSKSAPALQQASIAMTAPKTYISAVSVETLFFLILIGFAIIFTRHNQQRAQIIQAEQGVLRELQDDVMQIYQAFVERKMSFSNIIYRDTESRIMRLREKLRFGTPFGRTQAAASIEAQIKTNIQLLRSITERLPEHLNSNPDEYSKEINDLVSATLQSLERREKLLIK